ncbi:MAG: hypothetical protein ACR2FZ_02495 [Thermoleophilaceae bacterium]
MPNRSTGSLPRTETTCPTCGARAEEGQLVCLECGSRVALDYRRPPSWRLPVAIVAGVVLLAAAGTALALRSIGDDAEREVSRTPVKVKGGGEAPRPRPDDKAGKAKARAPKSPRKKRPATEKPAEATTGLVKRGALYGWPRDLKAFTVVLLSAEDRTSAENFARSSLEGRPAKIGVIRADDFDSLPKGFFVVFAGQYKSREVAEQAAERLGGRFPGSFPQLVER